MRLIIIVLLILGTACSTGRSDMVRHYVNRFDQNAVEFPWRNDYLEVKSGERHILNLPPFAEGGMCFIVFAYSYDNDPPEFDLYARAGNETMTLDSLRGRSAAVLFRVPTNPSLGNIMVDTFLGEGEVSLRAFRVKEELCEQYGAPRRIPGNKD